MKKKRGIIGAIYIPIVNIRENAFSLQLGFGAFYGP